MIDNPKARAELLEVLDFQALRSYEIVDEILRVSRVIQKSGKITVVKSKADIVEIINNLVKGFQRKVSEKKLSIKSKQQH